MTNYHFWVNYHLNTLGFFVGFFSPTTVVLLASIRTRGSPWFCQN